MPKKSAGCSKCGEMTWWIAKDNGVKCTGCETIIMGKGPFRWQSAGCSRCGAITWWVHDTDDFQVCTGCGVGG
jgi:DNA-directed RNA polymerase subunit RPC12/RpoP